MEGIVAKSLTNSYYKRLVIWKEKNNDALLLPMFSRTNKNASPQNIPRDPARRYVGTGFFVKY